MSLKGLSNQFSLFVGLFCLCKLLPVPEFIWAQDSILQEGMFQQLSSTQPFWRVNSQGFLQKTLVLGSKSVSGCIHQLAFHSPDFVLRNSSSTEQASPISHQVPTHDTNTPHIKCRENSILFSTCLRGAERRSIISVRGRTCSHAEAKIWNFELSSGEN